MLYTGGTTGRPKGVALSQRVWSNTILTVSSDFELPACPRYLAASPITHASGMMIVPTLLRGGTVYLHPGFDPGRFLGTIESERINLCFGVPTMIYVLLDHPALAQPEIAFADHQPIAEHGANGVPQRAAFAIVLGVIAQHILSQFRRADHHDRCQT